MSLYGLGILRKHYLTQEAANNAIKKKEELINRLTKHRYIKRMETRMGT